MCIHRFPRATVRNLACPQCGPARFSRRRPLSRAISCDDDLRSTTLPVGDRSRAPPFAHKPIEITANRKEARLSGHGQDFSLSNDRASIPFPFHHPLLLFLPTVFPLSDSSIVIDAEFFEQDTSALRRRGGLKRGQVLRETYSSFKFSNPYLSLECKPIVKIIII